MGPQAAINAVYYNQLQAIADDDERAARTEELRARVRRGHRHPAPRLRARGRRGHPARGSRGRADPPVRARGRQASPVAGRSAIRSRRCSARLPLSVRHRSVDPVDQQQPELDRRVERVLVDRGRWVSSRWCDRGASPRSSRQPIAIAGSRARARRKRRRRPAAACGAIRGEAPRRRSASPARVADGRSGAAPARPSLRHQRGLPPRAGRDPEHDRVRRALLRSVGAQVAAQAELFAVAGAREHELDGEVGRGRGAERAGELDRHRDPARVVARRRRPVRGARSSSSSAKPSTSATVGGSWIAPMRLRVVALEPQERDHEQP